MKKGKTNGNACYVVAWCSYDEECNLLDGDILYSLFPSQEKAVKEVKGLIRAEIADELECYDKDDAVAIFGSTDVGEIMKRCTSEQSKCSIVFDFEPANRLTKYSIRKFDVTAGE